jgi:hypothetical protein
MKVCRTVSVVARLQGSNGLRRLSPRLFSCMLCKLVLTSNLRPEGVQRSSCCAVLIQPCNITDWGAQYLHMVCWGLCILLLLPGNCHRPAHAGPGIDHRGWHTGSSATRGRAVCGGKSWWNMAVRCVLTESSCPLTVSGSSTTEFTVGVTVWTSCHSLVDHINPCLPC